MPKDADVEPAVIEPRSGATVMPTPMYAPFETVTISALVEIASEVELDRHPRRPVTKGDENGLER